jgi:hypothetical protein
MDILTQNIINGVTTYSLTDNGFALVNEWFRTFAFISALFMFLFAFLLLYKIVNK